MSHEHLPAVQEVTGLFFLVPPEKITGYPFKMVIYPLKMVICPLKMVIFYSFLYVYQAGYHGVPMKTLANFSWIPRLAQNKLAS